MMEEVNAKTGSDTRSYEEIMGQHWLGELNDNGERFTDLCALNNLVTERSVFQHKGYTRQFGYHLTCQQRTRQTTYASGESLGNLSKMSE